MATVFQFGPRKGFGPILLGSSRTGVRATMASANLDLSGSRDTMDYFANSAIQVEYDDAGNASFIGVSCSPLFDAHYLGIDVFRVNALKFFQTLADAEPAGRFEFNRNEHYFPTQVMTLWDADTQYDRWGGEKTLVWAQVGIGDATYAEFRAQLNSRA